VVVVLRLSVVLKMRIVSMSLLWSLKDYCRGCCAVYYTIYVIEPDINDKKAILALTDDQQLSEYY
jgi:hypothetical protein